MAEPSTEKVLHIPFCRLYLRYHTQRDGNKNCAVYVVLGYDVNGIKDVLRLWIGESEGKH